MIAGLLLQSFMIDRAAVQPRWCPGLEAAQREARMLQALREPDRRRIANPAGWPLLEPEMDHTAQERAGGQHHGTSMPSLAVGCLYTHRMAPLIEDQVLDRDGLDGQVCLFCQQLLDRGTIQGTVGLSPRPPHGGTLTAVEHTKLDAGAVGRARHDAVQGVDLTHQVTPTQAADRRVARHDPHGRKFVRQKDRARAQACARRRRLTACVAAADDHHVALVIAAHGSCCGDACLARQWFGAPTSPRLPPRPPSGVSGTSSLRARIGRGPHVTLFERRRYDVKPTEEGETLGATVWVALQELAGSAERLRARGDGRLTIFSDMSLGNPLAAPCVGEFQRVNPRLKLRILSSYDPIEAMREEFDIGLQCGPLG